MSAAEQIRELIQSHLVGRKIDVVGFLDALMTLSRATGEIQCSLADEGALRFELRGHEACVVPLDACRSKLRMLCARLGVLCNERHDAAVSPYGGAGTIASQPSNGTDGGMPTWTVRFKNTPDEHEFTIIPAKVESATHA